MNLYIAKLSVIAAVLLLVGCGGGAGGNGDSGTGASNPTTSLNWVAPTTRSDGTSLSMPEIEGYKIYMGAEATELSLFAEITDAYTMDYVINSLPSGTYYFAVTTYTVDYAESDISTVVKKVI